MCVIISCSFLVPSIFLGSYYFALQLAHGLDRAKNNRSSSIFVWDVIRETGAKRQTDVNSVSGFSNGFPADSLYNMEKFASDIYAKDRHIQYFCDRPLCDACRLSYLDPSVLL